MPRRTTGVLALTACLAIVGASPASGQVVGPDFSSAYSLEDLGTPPAVPSNIGGLTLKAGTADRLLIGGDANDPLGALYEIGVTRDAGGHINGFSGDATLFADADNNDGGVAYGPGGVLFLSRYDLNEVGQIKPGSAVTDKVISLAPAVAASPGTLTFVPPGQPGAGSLKLASFNGGQWYDADVVPDGTGTYDLTNVTPVPNTIVPGGPEGIVYVNPGSPQFSGPSVLISEWGAGTVGAYAVDANGDPVIASRRDFVTALGGAEGAFLDPFTGDVLFSAWGGDRVIVVRGFARAVTLAVRTNVLNDDGGIRTAADFTVHVTNGGIDVAGSPQPGSEGGSPFTPTPGTEHRVAADAVPGYTQSISGDCTQDGRVTPVAGVQKSCTITANDIKPQESAPQLPPPVPGEQVNALPARGTVKVKLPGTNTFVELDDARQVPVGTVIDTLKGRVTLVAASNRSGGTATATFYDGIFKLGQSKGAKPTTSLKLVEKLSCGRRGRASAAARKKKRRLWGNGSGKFRTDGSYSSATVRGTKWMVQDSCTSTLTKVAIGTVTVRDFVKRKTVVVRARKQYIARKR